MTPQSTKTIMAGIERDAEQKPRFFTLTRDSEVATLNPGRSWARVDEFKWVTRGLIEPPQSFHIHPDATVDINGETIRLDDPEGCLKLEREINKHHTAQPLAHPAQTSKAPVAQAHPHPSNQVWFAVRLDHFGHLSVEAHRGQERVETGLRGIPNLVHMGLMRPAQALHVDPLQRGLELDGAWFEATDAGAQHLAEVLNARYAPTLDAESDIAIEIKENAAASTGFDIHFFTVSSGARFEVKGHLSQERLDILQDPVKSDLLQPGILLRLSPPHLLIRRRRSDGGEEHIPEIPDVPYRRVSAHELQAIFNHPLIRRREGTTAAARADEPPPAIVELRVTHNLANRKLLWLECVTTAGGAPQSRAFTHHNIADLQHQGAFLPHLDVTLSLDNRTLGILDRQTGLEERLELDSASDESQLALAGRRLTAALKPPPPPSTVAAASAPDPAAPLASSAPPSAAPDPPPNPKPELSEIPSAPLAAPETAATPSEPLRSGPAQPSPPIPSTTTTPPTAGPYPEPFIELDPLTVNRTIFDQIVSHLNVPVQDLLLSLPRAFTDRRFEILSFSHPEVGSILDLRSDAFFGFYLSHVNEHNVLLVYACQGRHVEFGPARCLLQVGHAADPHEFKGPALLGLAQDNDSNFVFVVTPAYRQWATQHERPFHEACVRFATPNDVLADAANLGLIWPVP
jgi:hypothetical protein